MRHDQSGGRSFPVSQTEMDEAIALRLALPSPARAGTMVLVNGEPMDAELLARIGEGDENAFEILHGRDRKSVV